MDLGLRGLRAVVTGGTRGIGRAIADTLATEGAQVAICARNDAQVKEAVAALRGKGVEAYGESLDIADGPALEAFIRNAAQALGGLDILVVNASALIMGAHEEAFRKMIDVDLMGLVRSVDAALPFLKASGRGSVVAISSISAVERSYADAYSTIKAAQVPYVKGLAVQHAPDNIRANVVSPGTIYFEDGFWDDMKRNRPQVYQEALARNPLGRMGTPQEVANVAVFVASPAASFVSGANLIVDGTLTRRVQL